MNDPIPSENERCTCRDCSERPGPGCCELIGKEAGTPELDGRGLAGGAGMGRRLAAFFAVIAAIWLLPVQVRAIGFRVSSSQEGDSLRLQVDYDGEYGRVSACVVTVTVESGEADFVEAIEAGSGYLVNTVEKNMVKAVYASQADGDGLKSVDIEFKARKGTDADSVRFEVKIDQVVADTKVPAIPTEYVGYGDGAAAGGEAKLLKLIPDSGKLEPEFSPEITQYKMSVPYSVTEISFVHFVSPGASVSVNRRKLGSGGSDTLFRLTLTAEDGTVKGVYTVNVHRGEYATPTPKPTAVPGATRTPKPTATAKAASKATATPKASKTPKPTATPKASKTPKPTATPKAAKTPKPTATPRAAKTPRPTATPKEGSTPRVGETLSAGPSPTPKSERIIIETKGTSTLEGLLAIGGVFATVICIAMAGVHISEWVNRRREEELRGGKKK